MERYIEFITNHWMLCTALVVVAYLLIQELFDNVLKRYQAITPTEAVHQINTCETVLLDVSEAKEFHQGHVDTAINIPSTKLETKLGELEKYKNTPMIIICHTGAMSAPACKKLYKLGFHRVINLIGGIKAWEEQKLPLNRAGKP